MTTIVDSKTVTSCVCPECKKTVEIDTNNFPYYTELEGIYFKANLQEVDCPECYNNFYASENGLHRIPEEFLSKTDKEKNNFSGKLVKFYAYQDVKDGNDVVFTFSPSGKYKCLSDKNGSADIVFPGNKKSHPFSKNLVYLSE